MKTLAKSSAGSSMHLDAGGSAEFHQPSDEARRELLQQWLSQEFTLQLVENAVQLSHSTTVDDFLFADAPAHRVQRGDWRLDGDGMTARASFAWNLTERATLRGWVLLSESGAVVAAKAGFTAPSGEKIACIEVAAGGESSVQAAVVLAV